MRYILLFLFVFQSYSYSQGNDKGALLKLIENTDSPEEKSLLYLKLANEFKNTQIDSTIYFAEKGYRIAKKAGGEKGIGENAAVLGDGYIVKNKFDKAEFYLTIAANYWKASGKDYNYCKVMMVLGNINFMNSKFVNAFNFYHEALEISKKKNYKDLFPQLNNNIGSVYDEIGNTKVAEKYFEQAYKDFIKQGKKIDAVAPLFNLSRSQMMSGDNKEAIKNYNSIIQLLTKEGSWENLISIYRNISTAYLILKRYDAARYYINMALNLINEHKASGLGYRGPIFQDISTVYQNAAFVCNNNNQLDKALEYAHKSLKLAKAISDKEIIYGDAEVLSDVFNKKKRLDSALYYSKLHIKNYKEFNDETDTRKVAQRLLKFQYEIELKKREIEINGLKNQIRIKRNELIYLGVSIFMVLGTIIVILFFRNQKVQMAKLILNKEKLELEKTSLNHDLEYKRKELASNMMNLASKNEFIASIAQKLKELKSENDTGYQKVIQQLIVELNQNVSSKIWEEFEIRFKEVHSAFYENLSRMYPDLTPNEIKICAFLRLNMSTKDISAITHQSVKSINMARFRLRKKLNIENDENLISFLIQL